MRLKVSTDYALRVLIYLAASGDRYVPTSEIADAFGISADHLSKISKSMTAGGWLEGRRGTGGGVRLTVDPAALRIGAVVAELEALELVECFQEATDACTISPSCRLKGALLDARAAFLEVLDAYTLEELARGKELRRLLSLAEPPPVPE